MATGRKFYWIKLKKDFMDGDTVDFLMAQKNGAQYVVLYQMLCLMCINTDGKLSRQIGEVIIPFDVDKIQRDCKYFSRDTITIALGLFKRLGLIYEQSGGIMIISDFENIIGSETDYAKQKRLQRQGGQEHGNLADSSADNVHTNVPGLSIQRKSIEKEIRERDKRLDKEKDKEEDENIITVSGETVCQTDVRLVVDAWNELQGYGIKPVSKLSSNSKRYQSLTARIKQYNTADILSAIERIKHSDFLQGKNKHGWRITFDWFVLPNNFPKVFEGNYDNPEMNAPAGRQSQLDYLLNSIKEDEESDQNGG